MNAILALVIRILLLLLVYTFIGWISYLIYSDLRDKRKMGSGETPAPSITFQFGGDDEKIEKTYTKSNIIFGRDPVSDLLINDDRVSLRHCKIAHYQNQWWIEDLGSTNGTYLNNSLVTSNIVLMDGDILRLGHEEIRIKLG